jgi:hypothetical protein
MDSLLQIKKGTLVEAWKRVFPDFDGSPTQRFGDLGGNSITSIRILSYCRSKGLSFELKDLFELQTIEKLSEKVLICGERGSRGREIP